MLLEVHPKNPNPRNIKTVIECLLDGGVIVYPTDTIYGIGCDIYHTQAVERICKIKNIEPKKAHFSFICNDLSHLSNYTRGISTPLYRVLKRVLPGPYTFIFEASREVPKIVKSKKDTVGIRVPEHLVCQTIVKGLGHPIMSSSLPNDDDVEYYTDPEIIHDIFGQQVDIVINSGMGNLLASTVIDCTSGEPVLLREGAGEWESFI